MNRQNIVEIEKRRHSRLYGEFSAVIKTDYLGKKNVVCRNISQSGAFLQISLNKFEQPEVSFACLKYEKIHIRINLGPEINEIEAIGIARWGKEIYSPVQKMDKSYGLGIEFISILPRHSNRIDKYISQQLLNRTESDPTTELKDKTTVVPMFEKRVALRRTVSLPLTYRYNGLPYRAYSRDISCRGMFVITDKYVGIGETIFIDFSIPKFTSPLRVTGRVVRTNKFSYRDNICLPTGLGVQFENISQDYIKAIHDYVSDQKTPPRPELKIYFEPRFCYLYSIDLSIGCKNECIYCHFSELNKETYIHKYNAYPVPVDITPLYTIKDFPPTIFLSPSSDPFIPGNRDLTHEVLSYLLPKGIVFIILTKEIIPDSTLDLIKKYNTQFEGIAIGLTNLNRNRNRVIEPNCPSAEERLECLKNLLKTGVRNIRLRMDPIFPVIDDNDDNFRSMVKAASDIGVKSITGTYIFSFGKFLKRLKEEPILKESIKFITEKCPMQGGHAFTVPLKIKEQKYMRLYEICRLHDIKLNTCGCKENRLKDMGFSLTCRNPDFYKEVDKPK